MKAPINHNQCGSRPQAQSAKGVHSLGRFEVLKGWKISNFSTIYAHIPKG